MGYYTRTGHVNLGKSLLGPCVPVVVNALQQSFVLQGPNYSREEEAHPYMNDITSRADNRLFPFPRLLGVFPTTRSNKPQSTRYSLCGKAQ